MRLFHDAIIGMVAQRDAGRIHTEPFSGVIHETFKSTNYAPTYSVGGDGATCECSKNSSLGICRHKIYHRYIASAASPMPVKLFCAGIVNETLVQIRHRRNEVNTLLIPADRPDSPDLNILLDEVDDSISPARARKSTRNEPPKNVKYNDELDQCVAMAELVANHSGKAYYDRHTLVKNLNRYLTDGFPDGILEVFNNPYAYTILPLTDDTDHVTQMPADETLDFRPVHDGDDQDEYMFPAHVFAANSPAQRTISSTHTVYSDAPSTPQTFIDLQPPAVNEKTPTITSSTPSHENSYTTPLKFHPIPKGKSDKRKALFGSPSTPYNKHTKR